MKKAIITVTIIALCALGLYAQPKDSLAMLPFTGGSEGDGNYIVGELARQRKLRTAFSNWVTLYFWQDIKRRK